MADSQPLADRVRALFSGPDGLKRQAVKRWLARAVAHAETQPPKQRKRKAVTR